MKTVFLSDAHLKRSTDERYGQLLRFLADLRAGRIRSIVDAPELGREHAPIDDLYILGDFFDFWFCRPDAIHPEFQWVIGALVELQKSGVCIHLCEGNHDFFLKDYFQDVLGMEVFEEWAAIDLDGLRTLVSHGDTADRSDRLYLAFRRFLRSRFFYTFQRLLPSSLIWTLANMTSQASKNLNSDNSGYLLEKMQTFAEEKWRENYDAVILGHCHKPVVQTFNAAGRERTFVTLGDWITHYSFLYCEDKRFFLSFYPPQ